MKPFLLEITENGGRIHKDPKVIEEKKNLPNCFFSPDLSAFKGTSPSYFCVNESGNIDVVPVEKRGTVHFKTINFPSQDHAKKALEEVLVDQKEVEKDMYTRIQYLEHSLDLVNDALAKNNRVYQSSKDFLDNRIIHLHKVLNQNNKANNLRFALVLLVIIALKLIKGI